MNSSRCTNCGLVNSPGEATCRRCGAALARQPAGSDDIRDTPASNSAIPEYGLGPDAYAPPRLPYGMVADQGVWRDGAILIMLKTARLPDYCVKCGAAANGSHLIRNLSWHHPALYLLIFAGLLIYAIVALIVRKSAKIDISICADHIRKHRTTVAVGWSIFLAGVAFIVFGIAQDSGGSALFGIALVFAGAVYSTFVKVVKVKKIDDHYVWLRGIDENFLSRLPVVH